MKAPDTRVIRAPRGEPALRTVRVTSHAVKRSRTRRGRRRRARRLLALAAVVAAVWWVLQQVGGSAGAVEASWPGRILGDAAARAGAAYRALADDGQVVQSTIGGEGRRSPGSATPAPAATGRNGVHSARLRAHGATALPVSGAVTPVPPGQPGAARASRTPARGATAHNAVRTPPGGRRPAPTTKTTRAPLLQQIPASALLQNDYQVFETWNNCGPASLSMALSYFGIHESQAALGAELRPYQNQQGNNDDKDVTLDELARVARSFGLLAFHRPNGSIKLLKEFVANDIPVIAETVLTKDDDIGHYRVVKGYDNGTGIIIQDDSMQGHNVQFTYADFDAMWKKYNYEYLVLVPRNKQALAQTILGRDMNSRLAWEETVSMDRAALAANPADVDSRFNLSVALYYIGDYRSSVAEFEKVQYQLPPRTLWYQIEPIEAYFALGEYRKVFSLTDAILNNGNRAFSQLYIIRGRIYQKQGNMQAARAEYDNAVLYNTNLPEARDALKSVL